MTENTIPEIFNLETDPSELYPLDPKDYDYLLTDLDKVWHYFFSLNKNSFIN